MLLFIVISVLILPTLLSSNLASAQMLVPGPVLADTQQKALILSSIDELSPMRIYDLNNMMNSLTQAGYAVTYVADGAVTLDLITTQLNGYDVIIWRTNVYEHAHIIYYYVGQLDSATTALSYASDFASGALDNSHGILGASIDFFNEHFSNGSLSSVKVVVLVTSMSSSIANILVDAGVKSVIYFEGVFSLQFGIVDYLTSVVVRFLASGYDVMDSVSVTMAPFLNLTLEDPLDSLSLPLLVYTGDYVLTIA
jgi:hypothetical protein